ncbi:MAG: hypothetical protein NC181_00260 [Clostridium sp.]|nr:hypothetical protein [Clostridium sp.]MCM1443891.1 hypothetical protein [Candidatus Amulumruptor caecigallinarius]
MKVYMNKKPSVFVNKIDKELKNNEKVYFSRNETSEKTDKSNIDTSKKSIDVQLKEMFESTSYIYKADVVIKTKDGVLEKRVIGRNNSHLITMDNELIPISDIIEIKNKNE